MSRVLTNENNYYDIANTIRQMKNVNTTYKPREMASALKDIYSNEVEGTLPLIFEANGNDLLNYRIDGASGGVGDRTENLFDFDEWSKNIRANNNNSLAKDIDSITITANSNDAYTRPYETMHDDVYKSYVNPNTNYVLSWISNNNLSGKVIIFKNGIADSTHWIVANNDSTKYLSFSTDAGTEFITLRFGVSNAGDTITYSKIMLNEGSTALPYAPYGYKVPVIISGKNLLPTPEVKSQTVNGITISKFVNGIITIKGTPTAQMDVKFNFEESTFSAGSYIHLRNNFSTYNFAVSFRKDGVNKIAPSLGTLNNINRITEDITVNQVVVLCNNNAVGTNYDITMQPSIELTNEETSYEPYIEPTTTNIYLDKPIEAKANIPSEYTEVEYIESTGTQYIDTGFVPNSNSGFKTKIVFTGYTAGTDDFLIGLRSNSNYGRFAYTCTDFNNITFYCSFGTTTSSSYRYNSNMPTTEIIECELNYKNSNTTITQDVEGLLPDKNNFVGEGLSFYLAGAYNAKGIPKYKAMRQYKCELTQGTEVVRDLVPCYRNSDNVAGLYDLVNNVFYTNQGTGNFIVGPIKANESISLSDTNVDIPTIDGTNVITIDTTVQPSNVYIQAPKDTPKMIEARERLEVI